MGVDAIQLHGDTMHAESERVYARRAGRRVTQHVHVADEGALALAHEFADVCDAIHLDSCTADRIGGTGHTHDWSISRRIVDAMSVIGRPVILSGGLTPSNLAAAIDTVRPYAVDANSGVEDEAGDKSAERARAFVRVAHEHAPAAAEC